MFNRIVDSAKHSKSDSYISVVRKSARESERVCVCVCACVRACSDLCGAPDGVHEGIARQKYWLAIFFFPQHFCSFYPPPSPPPPTPFPLTPYIANSQDLPFILLLLHLLLLHLRLIIHLLFLRPIPLLLSLIGLVVQPIK